MFEPLVIQFELEKLLKKAWAWVIENWMNKIVSIEIQVNSMRLLWDKLWANPEIFEKNLQKIRNCWLYSIETREKIWKWF